MKLKTAAFFVGLVGASTVAVAGRCDEDFELVHGSWVATPWCRAVLISNVAREVGMHVSPQALLRNPGRADEVCRFVGSDYRVHPACEELHPLLQLSF